MAAGAGDAAGTGAAGVGATGFTTAGVEAATGGAVATAGAVTTAGAATGVLPGRGAGNDGGSFVCAVVGGMTEVAGAGVITGAISVVPARGLLPAGLNNSRIKASLGATP